MLFCIMRKFATKIQALTVLPHHSRTLKRETTNHIAQFQIDIMDYIIYTLETPHCRGNLISFGLTQYKIFFLHFTIRFI